VGQENIGGFKVPTEAMRNGDFSGLVTSTGTPIKIYDPWSTDLKTFQRNQFAYHDVQNTIDPSLMSPADEVYVQRAAAAEPAEREPARGE
jgi:hypothetical protein